MARKFTVSIDLNKNELINARIQNLASAPSSPVAGQIYFDTSTQILYFYDGTNWISTSGSLEVIQDAIGAYVSGGTGLTSTYNDTTGTTTIDLDNTAVTAGSYGSTTAIPTFTVDAQGRLTAAGTANVATNLSIAGDTGTDTVNLLTDTLTVAGGEGIDVAVTNNTITISGEDATSANKGIASFNATDFTVTSGEVTVNAERVEDIVGNLILGGTGIDATYTDASGTLSIDIDSTVTTNSGSQTLTNKILSTGTSLSANLDANSNKIINLATPTSSTDAANKAYVDSVSQGLDVKQSVRVSTTSNVDLSTDLEAGDVIDGVTLVSGNRVLVKNQTSGADNGLYVVQSSGAAVRADDANISSEVTAGFFTFVEEGTLYGNTGWVLTTDNPITLGTTVLTFTQFSGTGTFTAGSGLTLNGTEFSVDVTPASGNATLINTGGAVEVKVNTSDGLESTASGLGINNGTGLTFSSGALTLDTANGYGVRKYSESIGDASATTYTVTHNFGTKDTTVQIYENSSPYAQVEADVEHTTSSAVTIKFALAPSSNQYRVVVIG